ncbi:hypothetical protein LINGRAHAP2_LOCUS24249 [Linum grandiflorum]
MLTTPESWYLLKIDDERWFGGGGHLWWEVGC